jgi:membrane-bound metal-dependent hydrolase YbcI (DUF457 family)
MNWKMHFLIAAISTLLFSYYVLKSDFFLIIQLSLFAGMSALVPDLDHELSKGRKLADLSAVIFAAFFAYLTGSLVSFFIVLGVYFFLFLILKPRHRGITHSLFSCFVFSVLVYLFAGFKFAVAGFIGYLSHLVADMEIKVF